MAKYQVTQIEKRKRGPFGWVVAILFYGFNVVMILMMVLTWVGVGNVVESNYDNTSAAAVGIVGFLSTVAFFWFWLFGSVALGIMMLFTRGNKMILTRDEER